MDSHVLWFKFAQPISPDKYDWCHIYDSCWDVLHVLYITFVKIIKSGNKIDDKLAKLALICGGGSRHRVESAKKVA